MITTRAGIAALAIALAAVAAPTPTAQADPTLTKDEQAYVDQLNRDGVKYMPPEGWVKLGHRICADLAGERFHTGVNQEVAGLVARGASQTDATNLILDAEIQLCY